MLKPMNKSFFDQNLPPLPPLGEGPIEPPEADVSHIKRKWLDLPYANHSPAQKLDLYIPEQGAGPFPVIVHIHGGAFMICDKRDMHVIPYLTGLDRGYAVASVNYRLSGEATFPAGIQDIKAAIRYLRANREKYNLDGNHMAACGGSAGGYYSAMICLTSNVPELDDLSLGNPEQSCAVQAGVDWFGPTDFLKMDEQLAENGLGPCDHSEANSPESMFLGAKISEIPEKVRIASPLTYIHKDMPPMLIQHGRLDHLVPVGQSIIFVKKLAEIVPHDRFEFEILETADHADPQFHTPENLEKMFKFLGKYLK